MQATYEDATYSALQGIEERLQEVALDSVTRLLPAADRRGNNVDPRRAQQSENYPDETVKACLMAQWPAQRLRDLSGYGQVRERVVEKGLCVCKRELLGLAQEFFPRGGVERRP